MPLNGNALTFEEVRFLICISPLNYWFVS